MPAAAAFDGVGHDAVKTLHRDLPAVIAQHARAPEASSLHTTGTPLASDSKILFWVPRAILSGAMVQAAFRRYGWTSGTDPVTVTPGWFASARTSREGSAPTIVSFISGRRARRRGHVCATKSNMHSWFG